MIKKYLFILLAVCLSACTSAKIETVHPHRGNIQQSFTEIARTRLEHVYDISMPLSGKLERIALKPGDIVKKNQIIAQLELVPWQEEVKRAEAGLAHAVQKEHYQTKELGRLQKLLKREYATQADVDNAETEANIAKAQLKDAKSALEIARYHLTEASIRSPAGGIVLKRYTEGGLWLSAGTQLLQLGNFDDLEAVSEVLTEQAQQLHVGSRVQLQIPGTQKMIQGKVKQIEPAGFTKRSSLGIEEQRVFVIVAVQNAAAFNLGTGFQLDAHFVIGKPVKNSLIVPRFTVLQDRGGKYYVIKIARDGKFKKQIVSIGIQTDHDIEILGGLKESDAIVAEPVADML